MNKNMVSFAKKIARKSMNILLAVSVLFGMFTLMPTEPASAKSRPVVPNAAYYTYVMSSGETQTFTEKTLMTTGGLAYRVTAYWDWAYGYTVKADVYQRYGIKGAPVQYVGTYYASWIDNNTRTLVVWGLSIKCLQNAKTCTVTYPSAYSIGQGGWAY